MQKSGKVGQCYNAAGGGDKNNINCGYHSDLDGHPRLPEQLERGVDQALFGYGTCANVSMIIHLSKRQSRVWLH